jgi:hypothetical protein
MSSIGRSYECKIPGLQAIYIPKNEENISACFAFNSRETKESAVASVRGVAVAVWSILESGLEPAGVDNVQGYTAKTERSQNPIPITTQEELICRIVRAMFNKPDQSDLPLIEVPVVKLQLDDFANQYMHRSDRETLLHERAVVVQAKKEKTEAIIQRKQAKKELAQKNAGELNATLDVGSWKVKAGRINERSEEIKNSTARVEELIRKVSCPQSIDSHVDGLKKIYVWPEKMPSISFVFENPEKVQKFREKVRDRLQITAVLAQTKISKEKADEAGLLDLCRSEQIPAVENRECVYSCYAKRMGTIATLIESPVALIKRLIALDTENSQKVEISWLK